MNMNTLLDLVEHANTRYEARAERLASAGRTSALGRGEWIGVAFGMASAMARGMDAASRDARRERA